jgi:gliding motility-associated-like protein
VPNAEFTFTDNPATIFETTIGMQDQSTGDIASWQWISPGSMPTSSTAQNPSFTFPVGEVGQYPVTLIVSSDFGCTDTVSYDMNIVQDVIFFAPNAFTPDGDEFNQSWKMYIQGIDVYNFEFYIFNRWGEIIWESRDPDSSWDGTYNNQKVKAGTYVWKATAKDLINDNKYEFSGHINVLR